MIKELIRTKKISFPNFIFWSSDIKELDAQESQFLPMPWTSMTLLRVLRALSRTGSMDWIIPNLRSISLIWGCVPSMDFIFGRDHQEFGRYRVFWGFCLWEPSGCYWWHEFWRWWRQSHRELQIRERRRGWTRVVRAH